MAENEEDYGQDAKSNPPGKNVLGLIGFVVALLGLLILGIAATLGATDQMSLPMVLLIGGGGPLGALLSAIGLTWLPRGYAALGLALGLGATLFLGIIAFDKMTSLPPGPSGGGGSRASAATQPRDDAPSAGAMGAQTQASSGETVTVDLDADGAITIEGRRYAESALDTYLQEQAARKPRPRIVVACNIKTPAGKIDRIYRMCVSMRLEVRLGKVSE